MYQTYMKGAADREEREHHSRVWLAWHIAALPRAKKFPRMVDLMPKKKPERQTPEQMLSAALRWDAAVNAKR